jgi:hypothetical protein
MRRKSGAPDSEREQELPLSANEVWWTPSRHSSPGAGCSRATRVDSEFGRDCGMAATRVVWSRAICSYREQRRCDVGERENEAREARHTVGDADPGKQQEQRERERERETRAMRQVSERKRQEHSTLDARCKGTKTMELKISCNLVSPQRLFRKRLGAGCGMWGEREGEAKLQQPESQGRRRRD